MIIFPIFIFIIINKFILHIKGFIFIILSILRIPCNISYYIIFVWIISIVYSFSINDNFFFLSFHFISWFIHNIIIRIKYIIIFCFINIIIFFIKICTFINKMIFISIIAFLRFIIFSYIIIFCKFCFICSFII